MSEIKLYIGDDYLDLSDAKSIPLNIQTQTIFKPAEVKGNFSRSFDIPRTDRNCRILNFSFDYTIDSDFPYQKIDATLVIDGVEFSKGFVVVENNGLSEKQIKLTFYNGNSYFFNIISNTKLRDCKGFKYASHFWNDEHILSFNGNLPYQWNDNAHYTYALVDYVGDDKLMFKDSNQISQVYASSLLPCIKAPLYKYAIENETGYKLTGEIFNSEAFNKMIFPMSKDKFSRRKEDAQSRIDCDMEYWIQNQYAPNYNTFTPYKFELLKWDVYNKRVDASATYTKYGNCNNAPYVNVIGGGIIDDNQGVVFAPDYTWSHFKLESRFTTDSIGNYQITFGDETLAYATTLSDLVNIRQSSLVYTLRNSKTGQGIPESFPLRWLNLPKSYNNNPLIAFDYILTIEFDFQTGIHRKMSVCFQNSMQLYIYYNKSSTRFIEYIPLENLPNLYHISARNWEDYIVYGGKNNRVKWLGNIYELSDVNIPSLDEAPDTNPSVWNNLGVITNSNQQIKLILEDNEEDYYKIVYGGKPNELNKINSIKNLHKSWITGGDIVPDETISWWIKAIANYFGCFIDVDEDNKEVRFKTWKEIYDDIPLAIDLTNKLVNHKSSFWTSRNDGAGQTSYLKFTNSNFVGTDFGNAFISINDNSIPLEATIIQLPFSATENSIKMQNTFYVPYIKKISYDDNSGVPYYYKPKVSGSSKQHFLLSEVITLGLISTSDIPFTDITINLREVYNSVFNEYLPTSTTTNQIVFSHFNNSNRIENLQLGFDAYALYNYHRWLNYIFDNFKVLTCYMKLSPNDVNNIDTLKPIYLEYYNCNFLLNRIYDWVNGEICKVELLKLN